MTPSWPARLAKGAPWVAGLLAGLLTFGMPFLLLEWLTDDPPVVRVARTGGQLSALVADGDTRVLVVNADDREELRAALGKFGRPWEPRPRLLIAPPDDAAAVGLWEALQTTDPERVVVTGVPGADPLWAAIERRCRDAGIELTWLTDRLVVDTARLRLTIFGTAPDTRAGSAVVVRRGGANVVLALDEREQRVAGQVLVTSAEEPRTTADVVVTSRSEPHELTRDEVVVGRDVVELVLDAQRVRVFGGTHRGPERETGAGR